MSMIAGDAQPISPELIDINRKNNEPFFINSNLQRVDVLSAGATTTTEKYIQIVPFVGGITKNDQFCGPSGLVTKNNQIKAAINDDNVAAIILKIESPGGQSSFIDIIAETIRSSNKPVLAYVETVAASAGYWIASQADEIYTSSKLDVVGSIGAYTQLADLKPHFEKKGIIIKEVYAPQSTDKNIEFRSLFDDPSDDSLIKEQLSELVEEFHLQVNLKREITNEKALAGALFKGNKAIEANLIDGIMSFDQVVSRAWELHNQNHNKNQNSNTMNTEKNYPNIAAVLSLDTEQFVLNEGHASLSEEHLDTIDAQLSELSTANQSIADLNSKIQGLETAAIEKDNQITQLNAQIEKLKKGPGAVETTTGKGGDSFSEDDKKDKFAGFKHKQLEASLKSKA